MHRWVVYVSASIFALWLHRPLGSTRNEVPRNGAPCLFSWGYRQPWACAQAYTCVWLSGFPAMCWSFSKPLWIPQSQSSPTLFWALTPRVTTTMGSGDVKQLLLLVLEMSSENRLFALMDLPIKQRKTGPMRKISRNLPDRPRNDSPLKIMLFGNSKPISHPQGLLACCVSP